MVLTLQQKKRAVIYCRVSTKEQVDEGNSLATQERFCKEYATRNGYEVVATFIEEGESAKTAKRTQLQKLIGFCSLKKNRIAVLIAYKIDRISRNTDDYSQIRMLLRRYGIEIKSTSEHFEDTPAGRFMENIIANVAQFDNDVRAERSIAGMKEAVREGRYVWQAPYGYSNVKVDGKSTIAINEKAPFVKQAFEMVAAKQLPLAAIQAYLGNQGMRNSKNKPLSKSFFYSMLRNELYTGWIYKFGGKRKGAFEPIISSGLFETVQAVLHGIKHSHTNHTTDHPDFPLRKLFKHPSGALLTGAWSKGRNKKYAYYFYHSHHFNIKKDLLETTFKQWLNTYFRMDVQHFEKIKQDAIRKSINGIEEQRLIYTKILKTIDGLKAKQQHLVTKNLNGVISDALAKESLTAIDVQIYKLQQRIETLTTSKVNEVNMLERVRAVLLNPGDVWEQAEITVQRKLQWFYFPQGIFLSEKGSRTHKICRLFKHFNENLPLQSPNVTHRNQKSNTLNWQTLIVDRREETDINTPELPEEIQRELSALSDIMEPPSAEYHGLSVAA